MKYHYLLLTALMFLLPQTATAHLVSTRFGEFYSGVLHPLSTLIHLLPWIAIALLSGLQREGEFSRRALIIFPVATFLGAIIGGHFEQPEWIGFLNMVSFFIGLLIALALQLKAGAFLAIVSVVGFTHGFANAESGLRGSDFILYVCGVAVAAYMLMTLVSAVSKYTFNQAEWGNVAIRAGGSWILAVGILYIGYSLMNPAMQVSV